MAEAPVAMMSASQVYSPPMSPLSVKGRLERSTEVIMSKATSVPKRSACF